VKKTIILFLFLLLSCNDKEKESSSSFETKQVIKRFELTETVKGLVNFHIEANKALVYEDKTIVYGVVLNFYKNGVPYATLTSDSGIIFASTNDMVALGNVRVKGIEGMELKTETLNWIKKEEKIKTKDKVIIITKDKKRIEGRDFESDPGLTQIKLKETKGYIE
jgi:LPS export ABC transporter protein LptC